MRKFGEKESTHLAKADLQREDGSWATPNLTIARFTIEKVGSGQNAEEKRICYFESVQKGLALNQTNEQILIALHGAPANSSPEGLTAHFRGRQIQLYNDPTIQFGGEVVGGLRIRAASSPVQPATAAPAPAPEPDVPPQEAQWGGGDEGLPF